LEVLDIILGTGATSRLYRALVIEKKLALSVESYYDADMLGPTSFGIYARPKQGVTIAALEAAIEAELAKLLAHGVTEAEVKAAKKRLLAGAIFARDSLRRGASAIGTALTTGQTINDVENWPDQIKKVTPGEILKAAEEVFRVERSVTGLLLPAPRSGKSGAAEKMRAPKGGGSHKGKGK
jgi:zinc protease